MSRVANALKMLVLLKKRPYTGSELSNILECSKRQVQRYRDDLEYAGCIIYSPRGKYGKYILIKSPI